MFDVIINIANYIIYFIRWILPSPFEFFIIVACGVCFIWLMPSSIEIFIAVSCVVCFILLILRDFG